LLFIVSAQVELQVLGIMQDAGLPSPWVMRFGTGVYLLEGSQKTVSFFYQNQLVSTCTYLLDLICW
jgi:hypothetical protein